MTDPDQILFNHNRNRLTLRDPRRIRLLLLVSEWGMGVMRLLDQSVYCGWFSLLWQQVRWRCGLWCSVCMIAIPDLLYMGISVFISSYKLLIVISPYFMCNAVPFFNMPFNELHPYSIWPQQTNRCRMSGLHSLHRYCCPKLPQRYRTKQNKIVFRYFILTNTEHKNCGPTSGVVVKLCTGVFERVILMMSGLVCCR